MPETQVGNRKIPPSEVETNPLFAAIELSAEQIQSTIAMVPDAPDYVKESADAFVESLRKWARGGKDATEAELAQQGKAPEHHAAEAEAASEATENGEADEAEEKKTE